MRSTYLSTLRTYDTPPTQTRSTPSVDSKLVCDPRLRCATADADRTGELIPSALDALRRTPPRLAATKATQTDPRQLSQRWLPSRQLLCRQLVAAVHGDR